MSLNLNRVVIAGKVSLDPSFKRTPTGQPVLTFGMATTRTSSGEIKKELVEYHSVIAWGKLAEAIGTTLKKGDAVYVEGRLSTRSWQREGQTHRRTEITASTVHLLDRPDGQSPVAALQFGAGTRQTVGEEEIPF